MTLRSANAYGISRVLAVLCLLALTAGTLASPRIAEAKQNKPHDKNKRAETKAIETLETRWRDAMVKADTVWLDKMLADDFFGISSNGTVSDKANYIQRLARHQNQFTMIDLMEQKVRMRPTTAIVVSQARVTGEIDGRPIDGVYRYTKVYGRDAGSWRVLNFEATRVSGPHMDETEMHRGMPLTLAPPTR
jgi:ketosteroid isomerase-like protein